MALFREQQLSETNDIRKNKANMLTSLTKFKGTAQFWKEKLSETKRRFFTSEMFTSLRMKTLLFIMIRSLTVNVLFTWYRTSLENVKINAVYRFENLVKMKSYKFQMKTFFSENRNSRFSDLIHCPNTICFLVSLSIFLNIRDFSILLTLYDYLTSVSDLNPLLSVTDLETLLSKTETFSCIVGFSPVRFNGKTHSRFISRHLKGNRSYSNGIKSNESILKNFWDNFINKLDDNYKECQNQPSNVVRYHESVFDVLDQFKSDYSNKDLPKEDYEKKLHSLQEQLEDLTMHFDSNSLFKSSNKLLNLLIGKDEITAKDYLKQRKMGLSEEELKFIKPLGAYDLEALIIHVLATLFSSHHGTARVRVASLIEQLDSCVRMQTMMNEKPSYKKSTSKSYNIGVGLLELLLEKSLIALETYSDGESISFTKEESGKRRYYNTKKCWALCNFDISLLPIRLNLPMVCKPLDWHVKKGKGRTTIKLSDMAGGYLSGLHGDAYNRFRILSSHDIDNYYILVDNEEEMCYALNTLQSVAFKINNTMLRFINKNRNALEAAGLLADRRLANINMLKASELLRQCHFKDADIQRIAGVNKLLTELSRMVQRARSEGFLLRIATAYLELTFYLPAFVDFRGRIYRPGGMHFHGCDLAKSLIVFADTPERVKPERVNAAFLSPSGSWGKRQEIAASTAFKFQKFPSNKKAFNWNMNMYDKYLFEEKDGELIQWVTKASDPFQYISKYIFNERFSTEVRVRNFFINPLTQDASASAYQLMGYYLLNVELARLTNLIPSHDGVIHDLYASLREELLLFLNKKFDTVKYNIIASMLDRKLVKTLYMPLIYGKTFLTMLEDIRDGFNQYLNNEDLILLTKYCHEFWKSKFPDIANFMKLINLMGWFCAVLERPIHYSVPYFTTVQDYRRSKKAEISVYDRVKKKRRKITLQIPTLDRDKRKAVVSTCVNFIHQKDAFIAMRVVILYTQKTGDPIYTVHDNFITTAITSHHIPNIYIDAFIEMGHPLRTINNFIKTNLRRAIYHDGIENPRGLKGIECSDPDDSIKILFKSVQPNSYKHGGKEKEWEKKVDELVSCYESYAASVCGDDKWNEFVSRMKEWSSLDCQYCVHY